MFNQKIQGVYQSGGNLSPAGDECTIAACLTEQKEPMVCTVYVIFAPMRSAYTGLIVLLSKALKVYYSSPRDKSSKRKSLLLEMFNQKIQGVYQSGGNLSPAGDECTIAACLTEQKEPM
ncbi:hypothetical protein U1Q18_007518 [Sarracenia purpurea var. burkii]